MDPCLSEPSSVCIISLELSCSGPDFVHGNFSTDFTLSDDRVWMVGEPSAPRAFIDDNGRNCDVKFQNLCFCCCGDTTLVSLWVSPIDYFVTKCD